MSGHGIGLGGRAIASALSRVVAALMLAGLPMVVAVVGTPAVAGACPVGQVDGNTGCIPYCPAGALLDTQSGSCVAPAAAPIAPPPPAPAPPPPAWNGDLTPYFSVCAGIPTPIPFVGFNACI